MESLREKLVNELMALELVLYSSEVQSVIEAEKNLDIKAALIRERTDVVVARVKLENAVLERISARLKQLEPDLKTGISNLENEVKKISNTLSILSIINRVTGLVAKIFLIV